MSCSVISSYQYRGRLISSRPSGDTRVRASAPISFSEKKPTSACYFIPSCVPLRKSGPQRRDTSNRKRISESNVRVVPKASLFGKRGRKDFHDGVGTPELIVIAAVSLVVFGPKGLADVAKNVGKALRSLQPSIKELRDISTEFKDAFEKEIGVDEIRSDIYGSNRTSRLDATPTTFPAPTPAMMAKDDTAPLKAGTGSQEYEITDEMKEASLRAAWGIKEGASVEGNGPKLDKAVDEENTESNLSESKPKKQAE